MVEVLLATGGSNLAKSNNHLFYQPPGQWNENSGMPLNNAHYPSKSLVSGVKQLHWRIELQMPGCWNGIQESLKMI
jgi:hypothetical protein